MPAKAITSWEVECDHCPTHLLHPVQHLATLLQYLDAKGWKVTNTPQGRSYACPDCTYILYGKD